MTPEERAVGYLAAHSRLVYPLISGVTLLLAAQLALVVYLHVGGAEIGRNPRRAELDAVYVLLPPLIESMQQASWAAWVLGTEMQWHLEGR